MKKTLAALAATITTATALVGLASSPASAATPQGVYWYGTPGITLVGAEFRSAVAGTGNGKLGTVTSATPAVCTTGPDYGVHGTVVKVKAKGTCVLVGSVPGGGGYDPAVAFKAIPVWF